MGNAQSDQSTEINGNMLNHLNFTEDVPTSSITELANQLIESAKTLQQKLSFEELINLKNNKMPKVTIKKIYNNSGDETNDVEVTFVCNKYYIQRAQAQSKSKDYDELKKMKDSESYSDLFHSRVPTIIHKMYENISDELFIGEGTGLTGYLDFIDLSKLTSDRTKGTDFVGRKFIILTGKIIYSDGSTRNFGNVFHQRYSDSINEWTTAVLTHESKNDDSFKFFVLFSSSRLTLEDFEFLHELVTTGQAQIQYEKYIIPEKHEVKTITNISSSLKTVTINYPVKAVLSKIN